MGKNIFTLLFFSFLFSAQGPKDITGRWVVVNVEGPTGPTKLSAQRKADLDEALVNEFTDAVFDFRPDHHFYLTANIKTMPHHDFWVYNEAQGKIKIKEYNLNESLVMEIIVIEKDSATFFKLTDSGAILKVNRKEK